MNIVQRTMVPAMLLTFGLTASLPGHTTTLSDLQNQCVPCHDVTVSPSGWVLSLGAVGPTSGRTPPETSVSGWLAYIDAMGDGKCGFNNVGPGGTSRSVAAQFMYDKQYGTATATFTFTPTPTRTFTPTATFTPTPTFTATFTATFTPTPTSTTPPVTPTFTATFTPTPTSTTPPVTPTFTPTRTYTPTPTPTSGGGTHTWYDYDYMGGRCFQKDHSIADRDWCEHHGMKGGGSHPSLTGWQRHAHLDYPGQKP